MLTENAGKVAVKYRGGVGGAAFVKLPADYAILSEVSQN